MRERAVVVLSAAPALSEAEGKDLHVQGLPQTLDSRCTPHSIHFMNGASLLLLTTALDLIIGRELSCMGGPPE